MKSLLTYFFITIPLFFYAQTQEATIYFNDGTSLFGYGEIYQEWKIKFRLTKDKKPDVWTDVMVSKIIFHGFEEDVEYRYLYKKEFSFRPFLLEVLTEGEVTLYADVFSSKVFIPFFSGNVASLRTVTLPVATKLYVKRDSEESITSINGAFKRKVKAYFHNCPILLEKVDNNEFTRMRIIELVNYYNDFCTKLD
ncbi:hypothetical protein [Meridianimaribacter flavus]|uniref:DUF4105 domain-containing protein n=1 Tax=Meridianimaribacter flavus TaxID=571115 RepID=A0ABY2G7J8_9FLAO|nr:hypothetical protein [Meridianimaribacter flavus]TDY13759.1 hypothetical protein A8975_0354 [Meridianimaribacter flavus]